MVAKRVMSNDTNTIFDIFIGFCITLVLLKRYIHVLYAIAKWKN